jgi:hypothetical protein
MIIEHCEGIIPEGKLWCRHSDRVWSMKGTYDAFGRMTVRRSQKSYCFHNNLKNGSLKSFKLECESKLKGEVLRL